MENTANDSASTLNLAEQYEEALNNENEVLADEMDHSADYEEFASGGGFRHFEDGSIKIHGNEGFQNYDDGTTFRSKDDLLQSIDAMHDVCGNNCIQSDEEYTIFEGTLLETGNSVDAPFELHDVTVKGTEYTRDTTDTRLIEDAVPVFYREALKTLVGKRIKLVADSQKYTERRVTMRGNDYHVEAEFLMPVTWSVAEPMQAEIRVSSHASTEQFMAEQRKAYIEGSLPKWKIDRLEKIPGWTWTA